MEGASFISGALLEKAEGPEGKGHEIVLNFRIQGAIRDAFTQKNWERAYNKHDNALRLSFHVTTKSGRRVVAEQKFVRKAALFWTRNPKISHRIWVSVVKDDNPVYPLEEEEARSALFDVSKVLELGRDSDLAHGSVFAEITVSWGKHAYIEPGKISAKSNVLELPQVTTQ